jgi:alcohol oxidase
VECISEGDGTSSSSRPPGSVVVKASRLVVVSAGAFGSPNILERSGIGSKEILDKNGISQLVDLPGVGEHYMGYYQTLFEGYDANIAFRSCSGSLPLPRE